jgi:hypothetical protein
VRTFSTVSRARQAARRAGRGRPILCNNAETTRGRELTQRGVPPELCGGAGNHRYWGGRLPRPMGASPPGAALPPVGYPAPAGRRFRLQRGPGGRGAKSDRSVLHAPASCRRAKITIKGAPRRVPSGRPLTLIFHGKISASIGRTAKDCLGRVAIPSVTSLPPAQLALSLSPRAGTRAVFDTVETILIKLRPTSLSNK